MGGILSIYPVDRLGVLTQWSAIALGRSLGFHSRQVVVVVAKYYCHYTTTTTTTTSLRGSHSFKMSLTFVVALTPSDLFPSFHA